MHHLSFIDDDQKKTTLENNYHTIMLLICTCPLGDVTNLKKMCGGICCCEMGGGTQRRINCIVIVQGKGSGLLLRWSSKY